jgi:hypothetical protein
VVVEAGRLVLNELERVRLVATAEEGAALLSLALGEAELDAPAGNRLLEIRHPQTDMVDSAES